jgi:hypothetical protein
MLTAYLIAEFLQTLSFIQGSNGRKAIAILGQRPSELAEVDEGFGLFFANAEEGCRNQCHFL